MRIACWRIESIVPPLTPPRIDTTDSTVSVSSPAPSAATRSAVTNTPRSDGIESNPQECTIRAPVSRAVSCQVSALCRTNNTSPVRSQ